MNNTQRLDLELEVLESRKNALQARAHFVATQNNLSMPVEAGVEDSSVVELMMSQFSSDIAQVSNEIAQKRLELFDLQG